VHHILLMRTCWRNTLNSHTSKRLRYSSKLYMPFWWIKWTINCLVFLCNTSLCVAGARGFSLLQSIQKTSGVHPSPSSRGIRVSSPRIKCSGHEANHLPYLMPRLWMSDAIPRLYNMTVPSDNFTNFCVSCIFGGCKTH